MAGTESSDFTARRQVCMGVLVWVCVWVWVACQTWPRALLSGPCCACWFCWKVQARVAGWCPDLDGEAHGQLPTSCCGRLLNTLLRRALSAASVIGHSCGITAVKPVPTVLSGQCLTLQIWYQSAVSWKGVLVTSCSSSPTWRAPPLQHAAAPLLMFCMTLALAFLYTTGVLTMLDVVANHVGPVGFNFSSVVPFNSSEHYHGCTHGCDHYCDIPQAAYDTNNLGLI